MALFGTVVGYAYISYAPLSPQTNYPFGPMDDIAGKRLPVLERNRDGDCLCLVKGGTALADIAVSDILKYEPQVCDQGVFVST